MTELTLPVDVGRGRRAGLEQALREAIRSGRLTAGSALPSSRALAADLGFSRATVVAAFEQLTAEGYLAARHGVGTVVAEFHSPTPDEVTAVATAGPRFAADFRPGEPDGSLFPRRKWQQSAKRVLLDAPEDSFGYDDPRGAIGLRSALSDYLRRARAVSANAGSLSVFPGFTSAIGFLGETLAARGIDEVAVEDPTLFVTRDILELSGVRPVPVAVDDQGLDVDQLEASGVRAVVVTPGHQYPLGVTMTPARRAALIEWARRRRGWIIEDDYDGEFRYDRQPIGALQGLDPGRVIYAGTASKSLIPGLRLAWLVVPPELRSDLAVRKHLRGSTSVLEQLTLADFIGRGEFDRHLRTVKKIYADRQRAVVEQMGQRLPHLGLESQAAGLHLVCPLPPSVDEARLLRAAADRGIGLVGLSSHYLRPSGPTDRRGLVLGYSRPAGHSFPQALEQLVDFLAAQLSDQPSR